MARSNQARIFLSYSRRDGSGGTKLGHSLERALQIVHETVEKRKWEIVDPMRDRGVETIDEKVFSELTSCDALIAEATTSVPNVMFEIGIARALDLPIITLINHSALEFTEENRGELENYLAFIGKSADAPLPADLGRLEFLPYHDSITQPEESAEFEETLHTLLRKLSRSSLSPGARRLRKANRSLLARATTLSNYLRDDHPMLRFVGGWVRRLSSDLKSEGHSFEVEARYYTDCLQAFQNWEGRGKSVWAIADMEDQTEHFWNNNTSPLDTAVSERVFLLPWRSFFHARSLSEALEAVRPHGEKYRVLLGRTNSQEHGMRHPLGEQAIGNHLLLIEPDLVGGYVRRGNSRHFRVVRDTELFESGRVYYKSFSTRSVEVEPTWSEVSARTNWIAKENIGAWSPDFSSEGPPLSYFDLYDFHIRAWIPDYESFLLGCARSVQREIMRLFVGTTGTLNLLEIGFGTGHLTDQMLDWIRSLNRPFRLEPKSKPVSSYWAVDKSKEMVDLCRKRLGEDKDNRVFLERGTAFKYLPMTIVEHAPYDVIFGSLVFHDLAGPADNRDLVGVLERAKKVLAPCGRLVFADPFYDHERRADQVEAWRSAMIRGGLAETEVDRFLLANSDMTDAVSQEELRDAAEKVGFAETKFGHAGQDPKLPFRVATLRLDLTSAERDA